MTRLLPVSALLSSACLFGIAWIVTAFNPENSPWYVFAVFVLLLFVFLINFFGAGLYLLRTRFYKRYSHNWYFYTSYKMALFPALFVAISAILGILQLVSTINVLLSILAITFFALWSYLGKKTG